MRIGLRSRHLPRPAHLPLGRAIALALLLKIILLALLWQAFFSAPQTKKMRMPSAQVEQHLLSPPQPAGHPDSLNPPKEAHDPSR